MKLNKKDGELALKIRDIITAAPFHGQHIAQELVEAARKGKIPIALACGLIEHESGFKNVFGHDSVRNPIKSPQGGLLYVTQKNYGEYRHYVVRGMGNQGVGPAQLTSEEFQVKADGLGGCWKPFPNMLVAFELLHGLISAYGTHNGLAAYNAGPGGRYGATGQAYATQVGEAEKRWQHRGF